MKTIKLQQANQQMSWYDQQEVKQAKKQSKQLRQQRSQRKTIWQAVE